MLKCVIIRHVKPKCIFPHVFPCKGFDEDEYVVNLTAADITWLGHTEITIKADHFKLQGRPCRRPHDDRERALLNAPPLPAGAHRTTHPHHARYPNVACRVSACSTMQPRRALIVTLSE